MRYRYNLRRSVSPVALALVAAAAGVPYGTVVEAPPVVTSPISAVAANGWQATMVSPAELLFSEVTLLRQGHNSSGAPIVISEKVVTTKRVRLPFPDDASLTAADVALSDYIYSTDTNTAFTNNSTEVSPKPVAAWVTADRAVVGNTLVVDVVAFHRNGQNGKPVAAVTGTATDGTTTVSASSATPIALNHPGDKNTVIGYRLTFDISTLTDQTAITVNGKVFPRIGGSDSVLDSSSGVAGTRGFVPQVYLKHVAKAANPPYAYVDSTGTDAVVDASGAASGIVKVSTNAATAAANPFASLVSAVSALKAATTVTGGFTSGCIIRVQGTVANDTTNFVSATYQNGGELIIEGVAGTSPLVTFGAAANRNTYQPNLRYRNIGLNRVGANAMGAGTTVLVLENVTMDAGGQGTVIVGSNTNMKVLGLALTSPGNALNFAAANVQLFLTRGLSCPVQVSVEDWVTLGCSVQATLVMTIVTTRPPNGGMFAFNRVNKIAGTSLVLSTGGATNIDGYAFVQNLLEKTDTVNATTFRASGDAGVGNVTHYICWNNTLTGFAGYGRGNILYDETAATARFHKLQSFRGNVHVQINHKSDIFTQNGARVGAWGYGHGVGCIGEFTQYTDSGPNLLSFRQDYPGLKANIGTSGTVRNDPLFVSYQGTTNTGATPVAGAGNGDYNLQASSPAIGKLIAAEEVLPFDLAGAVRDRGSVGAYR